MGWKNLTASLAKVRISIIFPNAFFIPKVASPQISFPSDNPKMSSIPEKSIFPQLLTPNFLLEHLFRE